MSGNVNFIGTQEEWDALVEKNKLRKSAMKKQTAVEWLFLMLNNPNSDQEFANNLLEQAKAMEKEQIIDANEDCSTNELGELLTGKQYYNENYGQ